MAICHYNCDGVVIFLAMGLLPCVVIYLLLTRDLGWRLGAYLRVDHQVLVV
jgi:hypothetical protein